MRESLGRIPAGRADGAGQDRDLWTGFDLDPRRHATGSHRFDQPQQVYVARSPFPSLAPDLCSPDGNGTSIFTNNGATARYFERNVEAGQIGINVPIPVPVPTFAWSGNKASVLGGHSMYGKL